MKHLLLTTIAAVVLVGCGESQEAKDRALFDAIKNARDKYGRENTEAVKQAIAEGADVNVKYEDLNGWAPLIFAALGGHREITELLIDSGAEVNAKSYNDGWAPLHGAAQNGHKEIAELLVAVGADVNAMGRMGTPLHYAAARGRNKIVELLIAKGADVNILNDFGKTPLDIALPQKQTRRTIPTRRVRRNDSPETAELLRKHGGKTGEELKAEGK